MNLGNIKKRRNQSTTTPTTAIVNYTYFAHTNNKPFFRISLFVRHICGPRNNYFIFHTNHTEKSIPHNELSNGGFVCVFPSPYGTPNR